MSEAESFDVRQAPDELARRKIASVTLAGILVTAIAVVIAWLLLRRWGGEQRRFTPPAAPRTIGILEQTLIRETERGVELRTEQAAALTRWGWVDRDAGVAQIPIDEAIEVVAASPLPSDRPLEERAAKSGEEAAP